MLSERRALVVLGMHRSGTSALARVLSLAGAELPKHLVRREDGRINDGNRLAGFWESRPLFVLHDEALESAGSSWHDPHDVPQSWFDSDTGRSFTSRLVDTLDEEFGEAPIFVAKDPRISRLAPMWMAALRQLGVAAHWVISVRNPLEVAASLSRRDGFAQAKGLLLWLSYCLAAERHTRNQPRLFVQYDDLLNDWQAVVARSEDRFGFAFPRRDHPPTDEVEAFLDHELRHHRSPAGEVTLREDIAEWVKETFRWFTRAAAGHQEDGRELDGIRSALRQAHLVYGPLLSGESGDDETRFREIELLQEQLTAKEGELVEVRNQVTSVHAGLMEHKKTLVQANAEIDELREATAELRRELEELRLHNEQARQEREARLNDLRLAMVEAMAARDREAGALRGEIDRQRAAIEQQREETDRRRVERDQWQAQSLAAEAELGKIKRSKMWRFWMAYHSARRVMLRPVSFLRRTAIDSAPAPASAGVHSPENSAARSVSWVRTLAFYLPQFHPIPENDEWWGKGFTEWANVTQAEPSFRGHRQPLLPSELGFYDLRVREVQAQQAALAREHGIDGFCYHYYWFRGRKLLSRPLEAMLSSGEPDFPFCISWANENWTRRWDGENNHVLLAQEHSPESDARFIEEVMPALLDPRYVTHHGKPVLLVYRADLLPEPIETTARWRAAALHAGLPGLHLCAVWTTMDPRTIGFDALVEFPPHHFPHVRITDDVEGRAGGFEGEIFDYAAGVDAIAPLPDRGFPVYRGVMPAWDNTPRRGKQARVFAGSTPELYGKWLEKVVRESLSRSGSEEQFVFVNAWNEWAEGATLEPSRLHGRGYLEATRSAVLRAATGSPVAEVSEVATSVTSSDRGASTGKAEVAAADREPHRVGEKGSRNLWIDPHCGLLPLMAKAPAWLVLGRLPSRLSWWRQMRRLVRSGRFDAAHYLAQYPDVARLRIDPLYHYVRYGGKEGRDPFRSFGNGVQPARGQEPDSSNGNSVSHYPKHDGNGSVGNATAVEPAETIVRDSNERRRPATPGEWRMNAAHARSRAQGSRPILIVSHDAARAGSQLILLGIVKALARLVNLEIYLLLLGRGELERHFSKHVHTLQLEDMLNDSMTRDMAIDGILTGLMAKRPLLALCNTIASSPVSVACKTAGLPVLSMVYELPTSIESTLGRHAILDTLAASRRVIVASEFTRSALAETYGVARDRLTSVHTGVLEWDQRDEWRRRSRANVLREFALPDDTFLVLGCGTIHHRKGTDLFVQVARETAAMGFAGRMFFLWVGADQTGPLFRQWCEHDVRAAGLLDRVRFAGERESTADYFGAADAFALTSREDPFPMVNLEAMARGVPVVAFRSAGGAAEAFGEQGGILVPYLDVREMARSLVRLREAPNFHRELGLNASRTIEASYQWNDYMDKVVAILESDFGYRA